MQINGVCQWCADAVAAVVFVFVILHDISHFIFPTFHFWYRIMMQLFQEFVSHHRIEF